MILPFLTAPERQGYQQVPATLSETDLCQHFYLTEADREQVSQQRPEGNRLGWAVQLGVVRLMGYLGSAQKTENIARVSCKECARYEPVNAKRNGRFSEQE